MEEWETGKVVEAAELTEESCGGSEPGSAGAGGVVASLPGAKAFPVWAPTSQLSPRPSVPPSSGGSSLREAQHMCPLPILARRSGP